MQSIHSWISKSKYVEEEDGRAKKKSLTSSGNYVSKSPRHLKSSPLPEATSLWSAADVLRWLEENDMKAYVRQFRINGIDGETLMLMDTRDLKILGVDEKDFDTFLNFIRKSKKTELQFKKRNEKGENELDEEEKDEEEKKETFLTRRKKLVILRTSSRVFKAFSDSWDSPPTSQSTTISPISATQSNPIPAILSAVDPPISLPLKIVFCNNIYLFTLSPTETLDSFRQKLHRALVIDDISLFDDEGVEVKMKKEKHYQRLHALAQRCQEEEKILKLFLI